jgi:hypothetical protein
VVALLPVLILVPKRTGPIPVFKDGDPPRIELTSKELKSIIDAEIKNLDAGKIIFNPPSELKVGQNDKVEVRIAKSFTDDLVSQLKGKFTPQVEEIKVGPYMGVTLTGTEGFFSIVLKNRETKLIIDRQYTEWIFDVTALKPGKPSLYLTAYNVVTTPVGERAYEHPTFTREITVSTTATYAVGTFIGNNWKELIGIVVGSGVFTILMNLIRNKRTRKESRPWETP